MISFRNFVYGFILLQFSLIALYFSNIVELSFTQALTPLLLVMSYVVVVIAYIFIDDFLHSVGILKYPEFHDDIDDENFAYGEDDDWYDLDDRLPCGCCACCGCSCYDYEDYENDEHECNDECECDNMNEDLSLTE